MQPWQDVTVEMDLTTIILTIRISISQTSVIVYELDRPDEDQPKQPPEKDLLLDIKPN